MVDISVCKICGRFTIAWRTSHMRDVHGRNSNFDDDFVEDYYLIKTFNVPDNRIITDYRFK